mgnify:CR=1 FL=1
MALPLIPSWMQSVPAAPSPVSAWPTGCMGLINALWGLMCVTTLRFFRQRVSEIVEEAGAYLEEPVAIRPEEVEIIDGYVGRGYALSRQEELNFIRDFARMEGVLLDPV